MVDTYGQETSAAQVGRKTLGQQPQREDQPQAVQSDTVGKGRLRSMAHSEHDGPEPLENCQSYTRKDVQQEEVHQEKEE